VKAETTANTAFLRADPSRTGVALQPMLDITDRVDLGYEALPRPSRLVVSTSVIDAALALATHTAPALLMVPIHPHLLAAPSFDLAARAEGFGVNPAELGWIIRRRAGVPFDEAFVGKLRELRALGHRLALDGVRSSALDRGVIADLRPDFVFLDAEMPGRLLVDKVAEAELVSTVAFMTRLGGRIVARGIDTGTKAAAVADLGVKYGTGSHLAVPVLIHSHLAEPGDEPVSITWFQRREVRVLRERGETLRAPIEPVSLSASRADVDERSFARSLVEAARILQAERDPERILEIAAAHLSRVVLADRLAIFDVDWDLHCFRPRVVAGTGTEGLTRTNLSLNEGITGWAFARGQPYRCADTDSHPAATTIFGTARMRESLLAVPLVAGNQRLGMIDLWRDGLDAFNEEELERCALFGFITAVALRNAQMYEELEQIALTDALTGLFNIRWWRDMGARLTAQSRRTGAGLAVLMVDLDHFKQINDSAGHAAGDRALRAVAAAIRHVIRDSDYAVRYGGEEFLLILTNSTVEGARRVGEALQAAVAHVRTSTPAVPRLTVSIGVAALPEHGESLDDTVQTADNAMYQAKRQGRDRVVVAALPRGESGS